MILKAIIEDQVYTLTVPDPVLTEAAGFFDRLDTDMARGWQMSREWVDVPSLVQRCQIIADKLLTALETENEQVGVLMAGYLLSRLPGLEAVELDVQGEMQNNQFRLREEPAPGPAAEPPAAPSVGAVPAGLGKMEAMAQAGQDVTKVFKVGKGYRFSIFDHATGTWQDAPLMATEAEAERLRQAAFKARYEALQRGG